MDEVTSKDVLRTLHPNTSKAVRCKMGKWLLENQWSPVCVYVCMKGMLLLSISANSYCGIGEILGSSYNTYTTHVPVLRLD